jgi:hypothetical protein
MKLSARTRVLALVIGYLAVTVAGLFLFRGIPVLNVGLGFPLGAAIALRLMARDTGVREALRAVLAWALATAAFTMLICWLEIATSLAVLRAAGPGAIAIRWVPLFPPPAGAELVRMQFFAVITAPSLQVLTTSFGGVIAILLRSSDPDRTP